MKKTLLITLDFWPNRGGVANYYYNLVQNLSKDEIFILTSAKKSDLNLRIYNKSLLFHFFWPKWIKAYWEITRLIKKHQLEMLWVGDLLPLGTVAYLIKKRLQISYFVSLHGLDIINAQKHPRKKILAKKILQNAQFITVNSQSTKDLLTELVPNQEKIKIIYPGVNLNFKNLDQKKLNQIQQKYNPQNKKIILTVGRLVKRKNHQLIIEALAEMRKDNLKYLIVGQGPELKNLKKQISHHKLNQQVQFLTNIENDELPYLYQLADIFVMVSKNNSDDIEGFGIVYLEAGLFQKPVIASNQGGSTEAIINNQTGILIKENDVNSLKNAIIKLLENENLANELGGNAYYRINNEFLWKDISKKLIKLIND